jgi:hypothetical protein
MTTQTETPTRPGQNMTGEEKIAALRELFADAPELGRSALERSIQDLKSQVAAGALPPPIESAGPRWRASRQALRADDIRSAGSWRRESLEGVPTVAGRKPRARRDQGRHAARHALRVLR